jgi:hypothetical protein
LNNESAIMLQIAATLKEYPEHYTDKNVSLVNYDMLNAGVEHGVVILEGTISNAENAQYAYMGVGQNVTYTFMLRVVAKHNHKDDTGESLRTYVRLCRTILDADNTLNGAAVSCRVTGASAPNYLFREGGGPYYRHRDLTIEVRVVEQLELLVREEEADPVPVP